MHQELSILHVRGKLHIIESFDDSTSSINLAIIIQGMSVLLLVHGKFMNRSAGRTNRMNRSGSPAMEGSNK